MAMDNVEKSSRRSFLSRLMVLLGGVAVAELVWVAGSFLRPRQRKLNENTGSGLVVAGPVERFQPGSVTAFRAGKFYLARLDDGGFLALHRKCTHLGCTVPWRDDEQRFECPCHGSVFDIRGAVISSPAPRALNLFAVRIENGIVTVDTNQLTRRDVFAAEQVVRA